MSSPVRSAGLANKNTHQQKEPVQVGPCWTMCAEEFAEESFSGGHNHDFSSYSTILGGKKTLRTTFHKFVK